MAWTTTNTPTGWTLTDAYLLNDVIYKLLENGNADAAGACAIGQFTTSEIIRAFSDRQRKFLRDTGLVMTRSTQATIAAQSRVQLPTQWVTTERLAWQDTTSGSPQVALERVDAYELDNGQSDWQYNAGTPTFYSEYPLPTLSVDIAPAPNDAGSLELLHTALATALDGSGIALQIPPEFVDGVVYGAIADVMNADPESTDVARASYCEQRYSLSVELAKLITKRGA